MIGANTGQSQEKDRKYMLLIISQGNWAYLQTIKYWAFPSKDYNRVLKINKGDRALVYLTISKGNKSNSIVAEIEFGSGVSEVIPRFLFDRIYPLRVPFQIKSIVENYVPFNIFIQRVQFIRNKRYWWVHFQGRSLIPISPSDYRIMATGLYSNIKI